MLHSTHGLYLGAGVMQPGMVVVEVSLAGVVRLVGMFIQLEHEGEVAQPPQLHLRCLGRVATHSNINRHLSRVRTHLDGFMYF